MTTLVHFGAHPGYLKTSLVLAHLQAGQLDEARNIIKVCYVVVVVVVYLLYLIGIIMMLP